MKYVFGYNLAVPVYAIQTGSGFNWSNQSLELATKYDTLNKVITAIAQSEGVLIDFKRGIEGYFVVKVNNEFVPQPTITKWVEVERL